MKDNKCSAPMAVGALRSVWVRPSAVQGAAEGEKWFLKPLSLELQSWKCCTSCVPGSEEICAPAQLKCPASAINSNYGTCSVLFQMFLGAPRAQFTGFTVLKLQWMCLKTNACVIFDSPPNPTNQPGRKCFAWSTKGRRKRLLIQIRYVDIWIII